MTDEGTNGPTGPEAHGGQPARPSRRGLLAGAGLFGAGAGAGGLGGYFGPSGGASAAATTRDVVGDSDQTVPFYGTHQAGIATPAQDRLAFGTMNVVSGTSRSDLRDLLKDWTTAAGPGTAGQMGGPDTQPYSPPLDTGEAVGSPVSRLTITVGYG